MGTLNELYKLKTTSFSQNPAWQTALENVVACIAPFAPYVTEELWHQLGHSSSVHIDTWPVWDEKLLASDTVTVVVQINGKVRAELSVAPDASQAEVVKLAKANDKVASYLDGHEVKKTIYVPGKLVSFVI